MNRALLMLPIRVSIIVLLAFWVGIFKSLVFFGESHLFEPSIYIASFELGIASLCLVWFIFKSFKEIKCVLDEEREESTYNMNCKNVEEEGK